VCGPIPEVVWTPVPVRTVCYWQPGRRHVVSDRRSPGAPIQAVFVHSRGLGAERLDSNLRRADLSSHLHAQQCAHRHGL